MRRRRGRPRRFVLRFDGVDEPIEFVPVGGMTYAFVGGQRFAATAHRRWHFTGLTGRHSRWLRLLTHDTSRLHRAESRRKPGPRAM